VVAGNRVALVTGGTRGIGRAVTERLADSGVDVAAAYATDCVAAESVRDRCEKAGAHVTLHRMDVSDPQSCGSISPSTCRSGCARRFAASGLPVAADSAPARSIPTADRSLGRSLRRA
jgi:NADP-dependent 3-hydroxy acid dehydrogenase YdfG